MFGVFNGTVNTQRLQVPRILLLLYDTILVLSYDTTFFLSHFGALSSNVLHFPYPLPYKTKKNTEVNGNSI